MSKPKGTQLVVAFLGELSADDENYVPDSILAVFVRGDRVYLVSQSLSVGLPGLSDCDRQWQVLWDQRKSEVAATAFNQCYASGVASTASYSAAVAQGQELVNSLDR